MKQQPLISIITPSYNQGEFIRETIDSILNQSYQNIEHWVIDGGSTDNTVEILKSYDDPRYNWISEKDKGQSDAINKGIARCNGDLFVWLNSDDVFLPGALEAIADAWQPDNPAVLYGRAKKIDEIGNDLGYCVRQSGTITLETILSARAWPVQPSAFIPLDVLKELGGVDITFRYMMDFNLWVQLAERISFLFVPQDVVLYRFHTESKSVAEFAGFILDADRIYKTIAQKGLMSELDAQSRADLFAARRMLTPSLMKFDEALKRLTRAMRAQPGNAPEALFILSKGVARNMLGESLWNRVIEAKINRTMKA